MGIDEPLTWFDIYVEVSVVANDDLMDCGPLWLQIDLHSISDSFNSFIEV